MLNGRVYKLGDNIDTDVIYPGVYLELTDHKEIGSHCLAGIRKDYAQQFEKGGIIVAKRNFGCGSSREHAPIALINMGAGAVIADSFARIFYRNAINLGLPLLVCKGAAEHMEDGEEISVDMDHGVIRCKAGELKFEPFDEQTQAILDAGGIKPLMRKRFGKE